MVIDGTTYSMVEPPGSETEVVVAKRRLLGHIDMRTFVQNMGLVGRCIQLAYHGMVAASLDTKYVELQFEVQRLGYSVATLYDKSVVTLSRLKIASTTILTDFQAMYGYLLDGSEDLTLKILSSVSDTAQQMAKVAEGLHDSFQEEAVREIIQKMEADEEQSCKDKAQFTRSSAKALSSARDGLKILAALMMNAALFWKQMQEHCKSLSDSKLKDKVEKAMDKYSDEKRLKLWTSKPFKIQAVHFYADWVALDCVCGEYMGSIKETQKELYKYIQENPTQEEAEKNVPSLAVKFQQDLQDAQKACAERDSEMQEEIRMLTED